MKKLFILLIFIGVLIMLKPINSIIKDSISNIIYRGNVVTGTVAVDNGDGSYDVFISESDRAYPKIFTLSRNPNLEVGDKVRILYKNGCKELPIILPPVEPTAIGDIFVYCWTSENGYCIKSYTANGEYISTFSVSELQDWNNVLAIDANNNVYCVNYNLLKCYDKNGNLLYEISTCLSAVCIGPDGYVYAFETREEWDYEIRFSKRASGNPTIIESKAFAEQGGTQAFIMDANKNIYKTRYTGTGTAKYNYNDTPPLPVIAYNADIYSDQRTLAIVNGVLAICGRWGEEIKTAKLDLSAYINESLDIATITAPIGAGNKHNDFILCAYDNANNYAILGRYKSDGTKIWETNIGIRADTTVYQVAAYPF